MMIAQEIASGEGLTLAHAAKLLPGRGGKSVAPVTVMRWIYCGAKGRDGRIVRLEAVRVGSSWMTSRSAIARFVTALTVTGPVPPNPSRARQAGLELDRLGL